MDTLYTIGYEGLSLEQFVGALQDNCIKTVIDVRELPLSRKPGFSKTKLSQALEEAGIHYESIRDLGSPRSLRHEFRKTKDWDEFSSRFMLYLQKQAVILERLAQQAYDQAVCLMCFENDNAVCHRSIVARETVAVADNGLRVKHL